MPTQAASETTAGAPWGDYAGTYAGPSADTPVDPPAPERATLPLEAEAKAEAEPLRVTLERMRAELDCLRAGLERVRVELDRALASVPLPPEVAPAEHAPTEPSSPTETGEARHHGEERRYAIGRWHRNLGAGPGAVMREDFDDPLPEFEGY